MLTNLIYNNYALITLGSSGIIILLILLLTSNQKSEEINYKTIIRALKCDYKIGLSQVEEIKNLDLKQDLILNGKEDLKPKTYFQILDILINNQLLNNLFQKIINGDVETKKRTTRTLLKIATPQAIDYTVPLLYDENDEIKSFVIKELAKLQQSKIASILVDYLEYCNNQSMKENLINAFRTLGSKSVPKLLKLVEEKNKHRNWIIKLLGEIGDKEIIDSLIKILKRSPSEKVKISIIKSLSSFSNQSQVFSTFIENLEDSSHKVRAEIAKQLRNFDKQEAYPQLYQLLKDTSATVRHNAAESLVQLGCKGIKYLISAAENKNTAPEVINHLKRIDTMKLISLVKAENKTQLNLKL